MSRVFSWWVIAVLVGMFCVSGQQPPSFGLPAQTNTAELFLTLLGRTGINYRISTAPDGVTWQNLVSFPGRPINVYVDSAAPYLPQRFYRAEESATNLLTGDHIQTTIGDVIIRPVNHASFLMHWNGLAIYNDPVGSATRFRDFPRADLILVSHSHGDHYETATISAVRAATGLLVVPPSIYTGLNSTLRSNAVSLANGQSTNLLGLTIEAVPAYNANHPVGNGNGYILTIGGKRFYMSGDTGSTPEMRGLRDIDVAFLCMNVPFTMNVTSAADAVRAFKPRILYPYHYRNQDGTFANLTELKRLIGRTDPIEVRIRAWY